MTTFLHGAIIGGTAAFLCKDTKQAAVERAPQTWARVAMAANHVFLVLGTVLQQAGLQNALFSFTAKSVFLLTPAVILFGLLRKDRMSAGETTAITKCSQIYFTATVACSLAMLALGSYACGLATLGMLVVDVVSPTDNRVWRYVSGGAAVLQGLAFAAWIASGGTRISQIALVAIGVLGLIAALQSTNNKANDPAANPANPPPPAPQNPGNPPGGPGHPDAPPPPPQKPPTPPARKPVSPTSSSSASARPRTPSSFQSFGSPPIGFSSPFGTPPIRTFTPPTVPHAVHTPTHTPTPTSSFTRSFASTFSPRPSFM